MASSLWMTPNVGAKGDHLVNICRFTVRCDRMWPSTQDTGFILVQATCPTSSLSWSVTLFLSPVARSLQWGYKRVGLRWGVLEVRSDSGPKGRDRWELLRVLSFERVLLLELFVGCSNRSNRSSFGSIVLRIDHCSFGESASPFIDEGDGFTRESE